MNKPEQPEEESQEKQRHKPEKVFEPGKGILLHEIRPYRRMAAVQSAIH